MIDGASYRLGQSLAKRHISDWHITQFHNVAFDGSTFPHTINSYSELGPILDTMQEGRFAPYVKEMHGLTDEECQMLVEALADCVLFQKTFMPDLRPRIPYSTMISHLAAHSKITEFNPNFKNLLEIGPGCGYTPFFLRHHRALENYSQTDACEGLYILQSIVDSYVFGPRFEDRAFPQGQDQAEATFTTNKLFFDDFDYIDLPTEPICTHFPWWRLNEIRDQSTKFDIVMSNANLTEFMPHALDDYLKLTSDSLTDEGVLFCQCLGGPLRTKEDTLRDKLYEAGFAPLIYLKSHGQVSLEIPQLSRNLDKNFVVSQGLFIKSTHTLFETYYHRENYENDFIAGEVSVLKMLMGPDGERRTYSQSDIFTLVKEKLAEKLGV
jgi:hypothetical protein